MIRVTALLLIFSLTASTAFTQGITLKGKVSDKTDKSAITGATIRLVSQRDTTQKKMVVTDKTGKFVFNDLNPNGYVLTISFTGYEKIEQRINIQASNLTPIAFSIAKVATDLRGVTVVGKAPPVKLISDTTEFKASQYKVNPDATAEDLVAHSGHITCFVNDNTG